MWQLVIKCHLGHRILAIRCFSDMKVTSYISRNKWHSLKMECIYADKCTKIIIINAQFDSK